MIKNDQQYKATKDQMKRFETAIAELDAGRNLKPGVHAEACPGATGCPQERTPDSPKKVDEYIQNSRKPG